MDIHEITNPKIFSNYDSPNDKSLSFWRKSLFKFEIYELFWIFIFFSVGGFLIETVWCLLKNGYIESRKGLVFGPFCPIYGVASLILIVLLSSFNHNKLKLALGSFFYGSLIEYLFSFFQQNLFGSTSWDYSDMPFNINGRVCLLYSLFWTILGVILIKYIYPHTVIIIKCIPRDEGEYLATLISIFILYDVFISIVTVVRAYRRSYLLPPKNIFEIYLDKYFNDQTMHNFFPNMEFQKDH